MPVPIQLRPLLAVAGLLAVTLAVAPPATAADPEFLNSGKVLAGDLPFSEAVRHGDTLYLSGQIGIEPLTLKLVPGGIRAEARQALENIGTILAAHHRPLTAVVKCTVMLADMADWPAFNEVWRGFFAKPYPARSALGANGLALGARVEVECLAAT